NNLLVWRQTAARDAANADYTNIAAVIQGRNLHLERRVCINVGRANFVDDHLEQRRHIFSDIISRQTGYAVKCGSINNGEIELLIGSTQTIEQFKYLIHNPIRTCARAV